ncbi:MAG: hypothetical protein ACP5I3_09080 [Thermoproteus sp.]
MEIPSVVLLYVLLALGGIAVALYVFTVYNGAVFQINYEACREVETLLQVLAQTAWAEPGNYTGYVDLYYPVVVSLRGDVVVITAGTDTREPVQCSFDITTLGQWTRQISILPGTGTEIVALKRVVGWKPCGEGLALPAPRLIKAEVGDGEYVYYVSTYCKAGEMVEDSTIEIYLK